MLSGVVVALPLTTMSSQFVIGSFEARFFARCFTVGTWCARQPSGNGLGSGSDQILSHGPYGGLRAVGDADLAENVLHVLFYGFVADAQRLGNFLVREAEC